LVDARIFLNHCRPVRDPGLIANLEGFVELIPMNPFEGTLYFIGGLLHLLVQVEDSARIESGLNVVGMQILQVASFMVAKEILLQPLPS
jgi:hypothetical protein